MKKIIICLALVSLLFGFSPIVKADTQPSQQDYKQELIVLITQEIQSLQAQLNAMLAQQTSKSSVQSMQPTTPAILSPQQTATGVVATPVPSSNKEPATWFTDDGQVPACKVGFPGGAGGVNPSEGCTIPNLAPGVTVTMTMSDGNTYLPLNSENEQDVSGNFFYPFEWGGIEGAMDGVTPSSTPGNQTWTINLFYQGKTGTYTQTNWIQF